MAKLENRAFLAYDIENTFGGLAAHTKIKELELAYRSTQMALITPGLKMMKSTAMSKSFVRYRHLDLSMSQAHLGTFQFVEGKDAADLYLLEVLFYDPAVTRSSDIIIASGDKIFLPAVEWLRSNGRRVHLYARRSATSPYVLEQFDSTTWAPEVQLDDDTEDEGGEDGDDYC